MLKSIEKISIFILMTILVFLLTACDPGFWVEYSVVDDTGGTISAITSDGLFLDS